MILISAQAFPPRSGGIQTLMHGLASAAGEIETVTVFADGDRKAVTYDEATLTVYDVKRFSGLKQLRRRNKAAAITRFCADGSVKMIICDSWKSAEHLPQDLNIPIIVYAHGNEFPLDPSASKAERIIQSLGKADHIVAVSKPTAERVQAYLPYSGGPELHSKPNPVSPPDKATEADKAYAESLWPSDGVKLLALCRLVDWKGLDMALTALRQLRDDGQKAQMVIAGEGPDLERLKNWAASADLLDHVHFAGRIESGRKSALYDSADIYVQPGRRVGDQCEGFGITYIEAGLYHLPSLSGKAGGAPDAVIDGQTGIVVDGDNIEDVLNGLRRLIDEPDLASHMGEEAYKRAQSLLWERQVPSILSLGT